MAVDDRTLDTLTEENAELLQAMIRNQCVNDGTPESGHETRNAELLRNELENTGADIEILPVLPGRDSIVARLPGTDPEAPTLMLMGHTDVVPVNPEGWKVDPFAGERIDLPSFGVHRHDVGMSHQHERWGFWVRAREAGDDRVAPGKDGEDLDIGAGVLEFVAK